MASWLARPCRAAAVETREFDADDLASHGPLVASIVADHGPIGTAVLAFGILGDQGLELGDGAHDQAAGGNIRQAIGIHISIRHIRGGEVDQVADLRVARGHQGQRLRSPDAEVVRRIAADQQQVAQAAGGPLGAVANEGLERVRVPNPFVLVGIDRWNTRGIGFVARFGRGERRFRNDRRRDPELFGSIKDELVRQRDEIELIASENYVSRDVLQAQGSILTNKYAEGYPGKRYYGGCEFVDDVETLAIERAKQLFGAAYANVQPHSGSQANAAVYHALCEPGDTVMGMNLNEGGHLTHGSPVNFSGKLFNIVQYGLDHATGLIDYDEVERLAREHRPKLIVAGFSAYSQVADWARFGEIAKSVGAYLLVDMAHVAGLIAAGVYPSPIEHADVCTTTTHKTLRGPRGGLILAQADEEMAKVLNSVVFPGTQGGPLMHAIAAKAVAFKEALDPEFRVYQQDVIDNARAMAAVVMERGYKIVSGGTDNHLFLVDLIGRDFTGKDAEESLGCAYITVNKNTVPGEPRSPFVTSGLRIGTPAVTTRGFSVSDCQDLAGLICDVLDNVGDGAIEDRVREQALELCRRHPVYGG